MRREARSSVSFSFLAKRFFASFVFACVLVGTGYAGLVRVSAAAPSRILMYQGRVLNSNGVPVSDTSLSISFALYDASSGGTCLWSNNSATCTTVVARTVTLTSGLFSEALGDTAASTPYAAIAATVFADNASVYLEVIVAGETLTPRKAMLAAPYAVNSDVLDGYNTSLTGGTSSIVPVTDSTGNLVITGSPQGTGVSQGSLYINPATGVVAADETLLGIAVSGTSRFSVDGEGDGVLLGDLEVSGNDITSTGILRLTSGGSAGLQLDSASGIANIAASDDFAVGATSLTAPFSVDESVNTVRIGDGANDTNEPTLTFYASDATDMGSIGFTDDDIFSFTGGNMSILGLGALPVTVSGVQRDVLESSTYSGTSGANLGTIEMYGLASAAVYSAIENATATDHIVGGFDTQLTLTGTTATLTKGYGARARLTNTSTNASLVQGSGYLTAIESEFTHSAAGTTIAAGYGLHAVVSSTTGTITAGSAVFGEVGASVGTVTTGYAGRFVASGGTNRYGLYAEASGGTTNYSGYFTGAQVQIDADTSADTPTYATTSGELYVAGDIENRGNTSFGDTTGTDQFLFTSAVATIDALTITTNSLTTGTALAISRASGGSPVDGSLLTLSQLNTDAGSDGDVLSITNSGAGSTVGIRVVQNTLAAHADNLINSNMLVLDTNDAAGSEDAMIIRSDVDGTPDTEFRVESDGDVFGDGASYTAGADYAEFFKTSDQSLGDYQVVCQDPNAAESVRRCSAGDTAYVMGVVSTNAAFVGNNFRGASYDMSNDPNYRKIGMVGQIDTFVNAGEGAIRVGDAITASATMAGYGAKARGPVRIVGFALEPFVSGIGTIRVLVQPQWFGGDVLTSTGSATQVAGSFAIAATTAATASSTVVDSGTLSLRGSAWSDGSAQSVGMSFKTAVTAVDDYRLSVMNSAGTEVASVGNSGDLAIAGRLYPSDRGASQKSKYIYYDGSSGLAGDFMRTNSAGWATGSYDFAEMFPSPDALMPGEIVVFGDASQQVKRSTGEAYSRTIAGIVSTRPGFLAGENREGNYPVALAGRVPTLVSTENGAINIGDPLTTSTRPGYAMKATEAGPILGYAAESFAGSTGSVIVYVNVSYYSGAPVSEGPAAENSISHLAEDIENFDTAGTLNFNGGQLLAIGSMTGANEAWRLEADGDFVTSGRVIELVRSAQGADVETYAATSTQMTVQISGTVNLVNGHADVRFADVDPSFMSVVDSNPTYRAFVTPYGATGALYVTNRTVDGFSIAESGAASADVPVDWLVIATRRDYVVTPAPVAPIVPNVSSNPISVIDSGSASVVSAPSGPSVLSSDSETATDIAAPIIDSVEPTADSAVIDAPVIDSSVPVEASDAAVDAPIVSDAGSDTVVSDAPAAEVSAPAESSSSSDASVSESSAPAPSAE